MSGQCTSQPYYNEKQDTNIVTNMDEHFGDI
jgi:hypothetical protein